MSVDLSIAARLFATALLLCAFIGAARAQEYDPPPATASAASASAADAERERQADERALAERALVERRQRMIDDCEQNHGSEIDCTRETDTELRAEGLQSGARVIHLRPSTR
jgi:hypothetical protein